MKISPVSRRQMLAACALAALPLAAMADDGPYVGVEGGANWQRHQSSLGHAAFGNGYVGGVVGGYSFANGLRPEVEIDYRRNSLDSMAGSSDVSGYGKAYTAMGNLWYDLKQGSGVFATLHPYVGGGIGYARPTAHDYRSPAGGPVAFTGHDNLFAYQVGAGVGYDLTRNLTLSLDYRALRTLRGDFGAPGAGTVKDRYQTQSAMVGLRYAFGGPAPEPMRVSEPAPAPAAPPPAPAPARVAPPAPRDSDGDGVLDDKDLCPNTPHGFAVDANGCIVKQTVVLRGVNFEFNSDRMTAPARDTLDEVAAALKGQPGLNVEIGGHTDSKGSAAYNLKLSKKRAEAVRSYLTGKGVEGRNLTAKGFGMTKPVASNDTDAGRAENRRVEFVVLNAPSTVKVVNEDPTALSKAAAEGAAKPAKTVKHKKKAKQQ